MSIYHNQRRISDKFPLTGFKAMTQRGGGGVLPVYMTGESDGASYCEPKKIHEPEIIFYNQNYNKHQNFLPKNTRLNTSILIYSFDNQTNFKT